ncbi:MAG: biopolymer transporter ExbD [Candidatus Eisenbacteria bacterium]|nr:biopolymer transporter ExbD [Candidatus Eisenbacteria bacterium]
MARKEKFKRGARKTAPIPTASMADIAFLLLVFFMTTTIFRMEDGLPVELPKAAATEQFPREKLAHIWVDARGQISINDKLVDVRSIQSLILRRLQLNPALVVAFNADKRVSYKIMSDVMEELKQVNATKVSFNADYEPRR